MIGCLTETTTCVVAKPLVYIKITLILVRRAFAFNKKTMLINCGVFLLIKFSGTKKYYTTNFQCNPLFLLILNISQVTFNINTKLMILFPTRFSTFSYRCKLAHIVENLFDMLNLRMCHEKHGGQTRNLL